MKEIENFIMFDKKNILHEVENIKKELDIADKFQISLNSIDSIFLKNLNLENKALEINKQIELNKDKDLKLYYKHDGKQIYVKSFGQIKTINKEKLKKIFKFLMLIKFIIKINDISYVASQYYRSDMMFENLETKE